MNSRIKSLFDAFNGNSDHSFSEKISALGRMLSQVFNGQYKARTSNLVFGGLAIIYFIWPADIASFWLFGPLGLLDDAVILGFGAKMILEELERFLDWEDKNSKDSENTIIVKE